LPDHKLSLEITDWSWKKKC